MCLTLAWSRITLTAQFVTTQEARVDVRLRRWVMLRLSVLIFIATALAGCSPAADPGLATYPSDPDPGYGRLMARNEGVLALVNGCVVLVNGSPAEPTTLVFPAEVTTFNGTAVTIRGKSFPLGTRVEMGGGTYGDMPSSWSVPATCPRGEDKWWATGDLKAM